MYKNNIVYFRVNRILSSRGIIRVLPHFFAPTALPTFSRQQASFFVFLSLSTVILNGITNPTQVPHPLIFKGGWTTFYADGEQRRSGFGCHRHPGYSPYHTFFIPHSVSARVCGKCSNSPIFPVGSYIDCRLNIP